MSSLHVVVGAGASGVATARLLAERGDRVRLVSRRGSGPDVAGLELVAADGTDAASLTELAQGAQTLFNWAMPAYHRWPADWPPLAAAMLSAAERSGAGYVMLGNPYGYGPVEGPIREEMPMAPTTVKGKVRAAMWADALAAHVAGRVRVMEVRASDFIGDGATSVFTLMVEPQVLVGEEAVIPADVDAPHTWAYIGDVARALVSAALDEDAWGRAWHVPSNQPTSARELATILAEVAGAPVPQLRAMSRSELERAAQADPIMNELPEMDYMYRLPFVLDSPASQRQLALEPSSFESAFAHVATTKAMTP